MIQHHDTTPLAIVPIFVNTGAALLPTIIGAFAGVVAVIFRPRELLRLCVRRPYIPGAVALAGIITYFCITYLVRPANRPSPNRLAQDRIDWAKVALEIIRNEERAHLLSSASPPPADTDDSARPPQAVIYRGDVSRSGYAGGASPVDLIAMWEYGQDETMYVASPVVAGDSVYGASCLLDPPDTYGAAFCLDARTGAEQWYTDLKDPDTQEEFKGFFSSPAVSAGGKYLVIGQGMHFDEDCELVCLDAWTGNAQWLIETPLHIEGSPAVEGDIVVAGAGAIELADTEKAQRRPRFCAGGSSFRWQPIVALPAQRPRKLAGNP